MPKTDYWVVLAFYHGLRFVS